MVVFLQITTAQEMIRHFEGQPADLVVCDGAPDGEFEQLHAVENTFRTFCVTSCCGCKYCCAVVASCTVIHIAKLISTENRYRARVANSIAAGSVRMMSEITLGRLANTLNKLLML